MFKRMYIYLTFDFFMFRVLKCTSFATTSISTTLIVCRRSIPTCVHHGLRTLDLWWWVNCVGSNCGRPHVNIQVFSDLHRGVFAFFRTYFRIKILKLSFLKTLLSNRCSKCLDNEYFDWAALLGKCSLFHSTCTVPRFKKNNDIFHRYEDMNN